MSKEEPTREEINLTNYPHIEDWLRIVEDGLRQIHEHVINDPYPEHPRGQGYDQPQAIAGRALDVLDAVLQDIGGKFKLKDKPE